MMSVETVQHRWSRSHVATAGLVDRWALGALCVAAGSRVVIAVVCLAVTRLFSAHPVSAGMRAPALAEVFHGVLGGLLNPLAHYDGVWFLHIAAAGYPNGQNAPFFPLYPLVVRAGGLLAGHGYELAGIALSTAFFLAAAALLYVLTELDFGRRAAFCAVLALSLFPTSFFFQAVYSESLFLLLSLVCFWCLRRDRLLLAGVAALLASLTRVTGVLLLLPMAMTYFGSSERASRGRARPAALLLPPLGLAGYCVFLWRVGGDPVLWASDESAWGRHLTLPTSTLWHSLRAAGYAVRYVATGHAAPLLQAIPPAIASPLVPPWTSSVRV